MKAKLHGTRRPRTWGRTLVTALALLFLVMGATEPHGLEGEHHGSHDYRLIGAPTSPAVSTANAEPADRALCHACLHRVQANRPLQAAFDDAPKPPREAIFGLASAHPASPELSGSSPRGPPGLPLHRLL